MKQTRRWLVLVGWLTGANATGNTLPSMVDNIYNCASSAALTATDKCTYCMPSYVLAKPLYVWSRL